MQYITTRTSNVAYERGSSHEMSAEMLCVENLKQHTDPGFQSKHRYKPRINHARFFPPLTNKIQANGGVSERDTQPGCKSLRTP